MAHRRTFPVRPDTLRRGVKLPSQSAPRDALLMHDPGEVDIECEAAWLLAPFSSVPSALKLIARHMQAEVLVSPTLRGCNARYQRTAAGNLVLIRPGLTPKMRRWVLLHELAEWHLQRLGCMSERVEDIANSLAGALAAPRVAFRDAVRRAGELDLAQLARGFAITETSAALRHGEVSGRPVAVWTPRQIYVRGDDWSWPANEQQMRRLGTFPPLPGVRRVVVSDDSRRVAWIVESDG